MTLEEEFRSCSARLSFCLPWGVAYLVAAQFLPSNKLRYFLANVFSPNLTCKDRKYKKMKIHVFVISYHNHKSLRSSSKYSHYIHKHQRNAIRHDRSETSTLRSQKGVAWWSGLREAKVSRDSKQMRLGVCTRIRIFTKIYLNLSGNVNYSCFA